MNICYISQKKLIKYLIRKVSEFINIFCKMSYKLKNIEGRGCNDRNNGICQLFID